MVIMHIRDNTQTLSSDKKRAAIMKKAGLSFNANMLQAFNILMQEEWDKRLIFWKDHPLYEGEAFKCDWGQG